MNLLEEKKEISNYFVNLNSFKEISVLIIKTLKFLEDKYHNIYGFLIEDTRAMCVKALQNLADGYNKYHAEDKAKTYSKSRTNISKILSNLFLLNKLNLTKKEFVTELTKQFNEALKSLNGLIKSMEIKI
ncbi:MAG: four helix bundle protein [Candidatus Woesearchaeota archaeon]